MEDVQYHRTLLMISFYLVSLLHSTFTTLNDSKYSRRSSIETSINQTLETLNFVRSSCGCAAECSQRQTCTAFVYSNSTKVCRLGSNVIYARDSTYLSDYQLFKSDLDYFQDIECSSNNQAYTVCQLPKTKSTMLVFLQQLSQASCQLGVSYGLTNTTSMWTDKGCRARFGIGV